MNSYLTKSVSFVAFFAMVGALLSPAPSNAGTLGWWRLGDSDGNTTVAGDPIATTLNEETGGSSVGDLTDSTAGSPTTGFPSYSPTVPGEVIHDPLSATDYPNDWSMYINGSGAAIGNTTVRPRLRAGSPTLPSGAFTFETFILAVSSSSAGADFAYHTSSSAGGWRLELNGDNQVRLEMKESSTNGGSVLVDLNSPISTVPGQWHHVGLIYEGNSQDSSNDVHLFFDYEEVASANLPDADTFGGNPTGFFIGSVLDNHVIRMDEPRYFDEVLALDGSDFLQAIPAVTLTVDRITGAISLNNSSSASSPLDFQGYSITSAKGALNADAAHWTPITGNYDVDGNMSIDGDDAWTVLTDPLIEGSGDLSEFQLDDNPGPGDGGSLGIGESLVLSTGGGWIPSPDEMDLVMELTPTDANGTPISVPIIYTGNNDENLLRSDLNHDGNITSVDWDIFRQNNAADLSAYSLAQAYVRGDLDGDGDNDTDDFILFRNDYDVANGTGSFIAMIHGVPEPASLLLLATGTLLFGSLRRRAVPLARQAAVLLLVVLVVPLSAQASVLSWYRMGDDDGALTVPPTSDGQLMSTSEGTLSNPLGAMEALIPSTGTPRYSTTVPGGTIRDPLNLVGTGDNFVNSWAFHADAAEDKERAFAYATIPGGGFSYEAFIQFEDVSEANGIRFAYHRNNTDGGWLLELQSDGTIDAEFTHDTLASVTAFASTTTPLEDGRWYHIGLIWDGNSPDATDDIHIFLDYVEEGSANYPDGTSFGDANTTFFVGDVFGQREIRIDESRYLDGATAASGPDDFLRLATLQTLIQSVTGEMLLYNDTFDTIDLANYQINSPAGALLDDNGSWNSLADQNLDPVEGGDDPGETWVESGGSGTNALAELFLLGSTALAPGDSISIGNAYNTAITDEAMTMTYYDLAFGNKKQSGTVEFALLGDMNGDGVLSDADVPLFIQALTNRSAFEANPNAASLDADFIGDFDGNGLLDFGDIGLFSDAVANAGSASSTAVPEPTAGFLLSMALFGLAALGGGRNGSGRGR